MNIVKAHFKGFKTATRFPRMLILIYLTNLLLSLVVTLPFFDILNEHAGNSLEIQELAKGFDFMVFSGIMAQGSDAFFALLSQVKWVGLLYLLLNIFFVGGILETAANKKFSVSAFFGGSGRNFFRMFFLFAIMLVVHVLIFLLVFIPADIFKERMYEGATSEVFMVAIFGGFALLYALLFVWLLIISDYAKNYMIYKKSANFIAAFFKGLGYVFRHFFKTYTFYVLLMVLPVAFFVLYFYIDGKVELESKYLIWATLGIQQFFILTRIWFRIWVLAGQYEMYADDVVKDAQKRVERKKRKALKKEQKVLAAKEEKQKDKIKRKSDNEKLKVAVKAKKEAEKIEKKVEKETKAVENETDLERERLQEQIASREEELNRRKDEDLLEFG